MLVEVARRCSLPQEASIAVVARMIEETIAFAAVVERIESRILGAEATGLCWR